MCVIKDLAYKTTRIITLLCVSFIFLSVSTVILLRFFNPPFTSFMVSESNFFQRKIDYSWTPISNMGENIALSVVATEDSNFCKHLGLDIEEIYKVTTRIIEIYLNTVETSLLTFGVNQASDKYYKKPTNKLTREQSVRIALTLPNPKARSPKNLKSNLTVRVSRLKKDINILKKDDRSGCFL